MKSENRVDIVAFFYDERLVGNQQGQGVEVAGEAYQERIKQAIRKVFQVTGALPIAGDYLELDESFSIRITHRFFQFDLDPADSRGEIRVFYRYNSE